MRWLLIILFCATTCLAQEVLFFEIPVDNPATFAVAAGTGNLFDLFYNTPDGPYHLTYDAESQTITVPSQQIELGNESRVHTAEVWPDGGWSCVVTACIDCDIYPRNHRAAFFTGHNFGTISITPFYSEDETSLPDDCCGALQGPRIALSPSGRYGVTGVAPGRWGVESTAELIVFPPGYESYPVGDHFMNVFPQFLNDDTLDIMSAASLGGVHRQRIDVNCQGDCPPEVTFWPYSMHPSLMLLTRGRQFLVLYDEYLFVMQPDSTRDTIAVIDEELGWSEPVADVHPDYGFAYLTQYSHGYNLYRVDTLGASPAMSGIVAWDAIPNSASVNFSTDGNLLVAYALDENRIGLAVVPWDAPLDYEMAPPFFPADYKLSVYPNPFNSTVSIHYELPLPGIVRVSVFNTLGQIVSTLHDGPVNAGWHTLNWSPTAAASGVYFVKFASGDFVTSRKILYIR